MQSTDSNLELKLNVNLRLVKPDFMQSTAVNLEFKLKVIFKLLSCNRPNMLARCSVAFVLFILFAIFEILDLRLVPDVVQFQLVWHGPICSYVRRDKK